MSIKLKNKKILGNIGEKLANQYLKENNYKILERNFYCRQGEIDIIARENKEIVFIEVKTRSNKNFGEPSEAVTTYKQKHIYKSAKYFLYKNRLINNFIRFDVIEVFIKDGKCKINHIKQIM